jgi:hypothetical protein
MKSLFLALGLVGALAPGVARAQKVKLDIQVVEASTQGKDMDPRLKHMENDFKHKGFAYSSYKMVNEQQPSLALKSTATVPLPGGKSVQLTPTSVSSGPKGAKLINMHVTVPAVGFDVDYSVGNNGTNFLGVPGGSGSPAGTQLFLVIKHTLQ